MTIPEIDQQLAKCEAERRIGHGWPMADYKAALLHLRARTAALERLRPAIQGFIEQCDKGREFWGDAYVPLDGVIDITEAEARALLAALGEPT